MRDCTLNLTWVSWQAKCGYSWIFVKTETPLHHEHYQKCSLLHPRIWQHLACFTVIVGYLSFSAFAKSLCVWCVFWYNIKLDYKDCFRFPGYAQTKLYTLNEVALDNALFIHFFVYIVQGHWMHLREQKCTSLYINDIWILHNISVLGRYNCLFACLCLFGAGPGRRVMRRDER